MMDTAKLVASLLLEIKAIKLSPTEPFTWASGWKSPIYCDNRKSLSYPAVRKVIRDEFVLRIKALYPDVELIAGVATGAIAHGVLVAEAMNLPFIYVRSQAKSHGLGNVIEGAYTPGQKTVIIEDLVSTGGSSLSAFQALKEAGLNVLGMLAIFTYEFSLATENFKSANCQLDTLSNYSSLLELALQTGNITREQLEILSRWRENPGGNWLL
ncbi:MAG: orotate phosphoribosyltransferase [Bacteroidales bacterium]|jgi:orotate phosphoribosyltransferase|nr:orotate phosphoribosyltransferase [Bacteroidales bacterium]MDD2571223.1 orotate phosphoribosyltransferase [Bacteroidales bacterium]MDD2812106.1 orotate phosphoribosyltransferase [Bacteroidales bacterium]MDD3811138.1 orotate phosphoribosyltransferase [Bacteroidales bacterium]MDD4812942.1 orotate phosphoribosyltransferase [Bacteroidales bacterium]